MFYAIIPFSWSDGEKFFHTLYAVVVESEKEIEAQIFQFELEYDGAVYFECK